MNSMKYLKLTLKLEIWNENEKSPLFALKVLNVWAFGTIDGKDNKPFSMSRTLRIRDKCWTKNCEFGGFYPHLISFYLILTIYLTEFVSVSSICVCESIRIYSPSHSKYMKQSTATMENKWNNIRRGKKLCGRKKNWTNRKKKCANKLIWPSKLREVEHSTRNAQISLFDCSSLCCFCA